MRTARWMIAALGIAAAIPASGQETRLGEEGFESPPATLAQMDWLTGQWIGEGIQGAPAMESWLPPTGGTMVGTFVQTTTGDDGAEAIMFSEHLYLMEEEGTLVLRLKHFNADLTGWEEKDGMLTFRLVAIEPCAAYFHALTLRCADAEDGKRGLLAAVRMKSGGELIFRFRLAATPSAARAVCNGKNDREIDECHVLLAERSEARRLQYRDAALARLASDKKLLVAIRRSEAAFDAYRDAECAAKAEHWSVMRLVHESGCRLRLTDERTRVIWRDWLYRSPEYDSGLPEPQSTR